MKMMRIGERRFASLHAAPVRLHATEMTTITYIDNDHDDNDDNGGNEGRENSNRGGEDGDAKTQKITQAVTKVRSRPSSNTLVMLLASGRLSSSASPCWPCG